MAKKVESRRKGPAGGRKTGSEMAHASKDRKQPTGRGRTSREEQRSGRGHAGQQSVAEMNDGAPSRQTSTAQDGSDQA